MKSRILMFITAMTLFAVLAIPTRVTAQEQAKENRHGKHHHYKLIDMGTFGGPQSYLSAGFDGAFFGSANVMNKNGTFAGWADTPTKDSFPAFCFNFDCYVSHALQWRNGFSNDLGSLAEGWSSAATWINNRGEIVGISQNGALDPVIGFPEEHAVLWRDGQMIDLGTLGGNQSLASAINNHGQVVGLAISDVPDPFSFYYQFLFCLPLQICPTNPTAARAFVWNENDGMQDLGTLGGNDAAAFFVNDRGQVAGYSYTNSTVNATTGLPTFHPFLWEKGKGMKDLGTLGGTVAQAVNGLNERGEVVGSTTLLGDQIVNGDFLHHPFLWDGKRMIDLGTFGGNNGEADWVNNEGDVVGLAQPRKMCPQGNGGHAFLWRHRRLHDLGTTAGFDNSEAANINSRRQIVGSSFTCDFSASDASLWENGAIVDLNTLIPSSSGFYLWTAEFIADNGEIAALGLLPNGDQHDVLLIPCDENHPAVEGCDYSLVDASATADDRPTRTQMPTTANPWVTGTANPLMRFFGHRTMPWYRKLGVQVPTK